MYKTNAHLAQNNAKHSKIFQKHLERWIITYSFIISSEAAVEVFNH
jgi:hypothetical protein